MSSSERDIVDLGLERLASEDSLEMPDPVLEERLMREARGSRRAMPRLLRPRGALQWVASLTMFLGVAGIAVGATFGIQALKQWWFTVSVDGVETGEVVEGDGTRHVNYTTGDGVEVNVWVGRRELPGEGTQTRVKIREEDEWRVEEDVHEVREAGPGEQLPEPERFPASIIDQAEVLHTWVDASGAPKSLLLVSEPRKAHSLLLVHEIDSEEEAPVSLVLRTARPIRAGGRVEIEELEAGALSVTINDGHGWGIAVVLDASSESPSVGDGEFVSPSGRVRVNVGD